MDDLCSLQATYSSMRHICGNLDVVQRMALHQCRCGLGWDDLSNYYTLLASLTQLGSLEAFFLTLDPSNVPPRSVIVAGIAIVPIEQYGDQIGRQIVPAIGGAGEIVEAWPGPVGFLKYHWYPSEEASL